MSPFSIRNSVMFPTYYKLPHESGYDLGGYFSPSPGNGFYSSIKKKCVPGHTIVKYYALQHDFMDGSTGLRIESLRGVEVLACSLETLLSADQRLSSTLDAVRTVTPPLQTPSVVDAT
ncbi:hypothetical protein BDZ89DRAFT_1046040, partial [Hymenopellis radicata]